MKINNIFSILEYYIDIDFNLECEPLIMMYVLKDNYYQLIV